MDSFEGQNLKYLLKHFGAAFDFCKVKAYVGKIQINQDYKDLNDKFFIDNLYEQCCGITYSPDFKTCFTDDGKFYVLDVFRKNKRYSEYPVELSYKRELKDQKYTISSEKIDSVKKRKEQTFKIYAEHCEI